MIRRRSPGVVYARALIGAAIAAGTLLAVLAWDRELAGRIVREDDVVEWMEVLCFAGAAALALVAARRPPAVLDVLMALMFAALIEGELDLDQRIFGWRLIDKQFLKNAAFPLHLRLLVALVLATVVLAVLIYAWRRRRELWGEIGAMLRQPWGHVFLAGVLLFVLVQPFERRLSGLLPLPRWFLEESLELIAALFCFVGVAERALYVKRARPD